MPSLVIKQLPENLHRKLKEQAARHHRSMTREAIALLERGLALDEEVREPPAPYKGRFPLTDALVDRAKREGRE
jgi:plasmid stability protein